LLLPGTIPANAPAFYWEPNLKTNDPYFVTDWAFVRFVVVDAGLDGGETAVSRTLREYSDIDGIGLPFLRRPLGFVVTLNEPLEPQRAYRFERFAYCDYSDRNEGGAYLDYEKSTPWKRVQRCLSRRNSGSWWSDFRSQATCRSQADWRARVNAKARRRPFL
jgi:hypothetical protein